MKQNLPKGSLILTSVILFSIACKKSVDPPSNTNPGGTVQHDTTLTAPVVPYPVTPVQECNSAPNYGDSILYPQPVSSTDFYVFPQNNAGIKGTYLSWPAGLIIDSKTGSIDLTKSETGERFSVAFVKDGTSDTCMSQLIIAGAAYMDSVYELSVSDTTSAPYFNANPYSPPVCQGNQGSGCQFDYNDFAKRQGIEVNKNTGFIDLQKTMKNNPFGRVPFNGEYMITTIYYKLNDQSNNAPQNIQVKLVYYNRKSDIPQDVLAQVSNNITNTLGNTLLDTGPSPRPPLIIIVRTK
jgi:hypothetical protein